MPHTIVVTIGLSREEYEELANLAHAANRSTSSHAALLVRNALPGTEQRLLDVLKPGEKEERGKR